MKFRLPISFGSEPYSNPEYQDDFWSFTSGGVAIELEQYYEHLNLNPLLISRNHIAAVSLRLESHLRVKEDGKCIQPELSNFTSGNTCFFWCEVFVFYRSINFSTKQIALRPIYCFMHLFLQNVFFRMRVIFSLLGVGVRF